MVTVTEGGGNFEGPEDNDIVGSEEGVESSMVLKGVNV